MASQMAVALPSLYHEDETAWLESMAHLVAERRFDEFDWDHLSEYLSDMARRDRRERTRARGDSTSPRSPPACSSGTG